MMDTETISLTSKSINYLSSAKKWVLLLAIIGFIGVALMILVGIFMGLVFNMAELPSSYPMTASNIFDVLSIAYALMGVIYFIPVWFLSKFSRRLGEALEINDQEVLTKSFRNLKNCLVSYRVITILAIILYGIFVVISFFTTVGTMGGMAV